MNTARVYFLPNFIRTDTVCAHSWRLACDLVLQQLASKQCLVYDTETPLYDARLGSGAFATASRRRKENCRIIYSERLWIAVVRISALIQRCYMHSDRVSHLWVRRSKTEGFSVYFYVGVKEAHASVQHNVDTPAGRRGCLPFTCQPRFRALATTNAVFHTL